MRLKRTPTQMRPAEVSARESLDFDWLMLATSDGGRRRERRRRRRPSGHRALSLTLFLLPSTPQHTQQVRETATSPEGLEEYLEFRAGTDLRWPYA
jgi:hypothetical protein